MCFFRKKIKDRLKKIKDDNPEPGDVKKLAEHTAKSKEINKHIKNGN